MKERWKNVICYCYCYCYY